MPAWFLPNWCVDVGRFAILEKESRAMITWRVGLSWIAVLTLAAAWSVAADMPPVRNVELKYTCDVAQVPEDAKTVDVWIPLPSDNERQTVRLVSQSDPDKGAVTFDKKFGNRMYYRRFEAPKSDGSAGRIGPIKVEFVYDVEVREATVEAAKKLVSTRSTPPTDEFAPYLEAVKMIPIQGPVSALAAGIKLPAGEPLRAGRAIYDHLVDTMIYNHLAPGAGTGNAVWACDSKTGDCTDFHSLFIGICRWRGIPADHVFGMPLPPDKPEGDIKHFHCWARFWVADVGWIPLDASRANKFPKDRDYYFGTLGSTWLTLSHGRDVVLEPPQQGEPINMFEAPYVEVDGRPFKGVGWLAHYRDHQPASAAK
jgi:transglutaminase-like putative cysteine protease